MVAVIPSPTDVWTAPFGMDVHMPLIPDQCKLCPLPIRHCYLTKSRHRGLTNLMTGLESIGEIRDLSTKDIMIARTHSHSHDRPVHFAVVPYWSTPQNIHQYCYVGERRCLHGADTGTISRWLSLTCPLHYCHPPSRASSSRFRLTGTHARLGFASSPAAWPPSAATWP